MPHPRISIRWAMAPAYIAVCLLLPSVGLFFAWRQPGSPAQTNPLTKVRGTSGLPTPLLVADQQSRARVGEAYGRLPLRFEMNVGQTDPQVKFISRGSNYSLFFTPTEAVLQSRIADRGLRDEELSENSLKTTSPQSAVRIKLIGANSAPRVEGLEPLRGKSNYFIGKNPNQWRRDVTSYAKVRYRSVYPGIDLVYYGNQQQLEYDFVVSPGADPTAIKLVFDGIRGANVDSQGDLVLQTAGGEVRQNKPLVYQEVDGRRYEIASRYVLKDQREVSFDLAAYDPSRPLVIDPVLAYSTLLGGGGGEMAFGIAVDRAGNAYVVGTTGSPDFPTTNTLQPVSAGALDVFVTKLNSEGSGLIYSTYLGGSSNETAFGIAVDEDGNAYVGGSTDSANFPTMNPLQPAYAGLNDAFVAKLNSTGSELIYSTYLGGINRDIGYDLTFDTDGNVYLTGTTRSTDFPTMNPLQPALAGGIEIFVSKLNADGSAFIYSTFLGGSHTENFPHIATDVRGNAYLTGRTDSTDFPTAHPFQAALGGLDDAFVTKLNACGSAFVYSTYLGSNGFDHGIDIAVDHVGRAYVTGMTGSTNFPTVNALQLTLAGSADAFLAKLSRNGSTLRYSTFLGGSGLDIGRGISLDARGNIYLTGLTYSSDFPTVNAVQPMAASPGLTDAFVVKLNRRGSRFVYSSYLGGGDHEFPEGIDVDARGNAYLVGYTISPDFPITPEAFQKVFRGPRDPKSGGEAFIAKIGDRRRHADDRKDR